MSEEKPTFKVTDRRLFNPDGTPREGAREEAEAAAAALSATPPPPPPPQPPPASDNVAPAGAAPQAEATGRVGASGGAAAASATAAPDTEALAGEEDDDPQEFLMIVEFIASFAAEALGMSAHPMAAGAPPPINLPLAKQCIDMLGTLQRKTRGNLSGEEKQFFELILSQLRMQYVSMSSPRAGGAPGGRGSRGLTGSDITGGR